MLKELNKINIRSFFDETGPIYHVNKCLHGDYDCRGSFKFVGTLSGKCIKLDINHYDGYDKGVRAYILKVRKMVKRLPRVGGPAASYIPLERKCVREDPSVGGSVMQPMSYPDLNVTAYAWVLSGTFSLQ